MKNYVLAIFLTVGMSIHLQADDSAPKSEIDLAELEVKLKTEGLEGWIHAANAAAGLYVFTWRKPGDFFTNIQFPLIARSQTLRDEIKKLDRHDKIWVRGEFIQHEAPQKHIEAQEFKILKKYAPEWEKDYGTAFPEELNDKTQIRAIVHAIANEGRIMVIEYKDSVIPVFVDRPELTKGLYRNDKIEIIYRVRKNPNRPKHLELNLESSEPLKVIERIVEKHAQTGSLEGSLIRFPASPQVLFDVFAIEVIDADGLKRNYTLVNFDDPEVFKKIREKLGQIWATDSQQASYARNKWVNRNIRVKATGVFNIQDPGQANAQILLTGPESLEFSKLICEWQKL